MCFFSFCFVDKGKRESQPRLHVEYYVVADAFRGVLQSLLPRRACLDLVPALCFIIQVGKKFVGDFVWGGVLLEIRRGWLGISSV